MKARICLTVVSLFTAMASGMEGQGDALQNDKPKHQKYKLVDLGTLGGPNSYISSVPLVRMLTDSGMVAGSADTASLEPFSPSINDANASNGFLWKDGVLNSLGPLPGGFSSFAGAMNEGGAVIGQSENGNVDPLIGFPELHAVVWFSGHVVDLGSFGGNESNPGDINNRGQVVGGALNLTADPFANSFASYAFFYPATTQIHAFLWQGGELQDLGTLGGPDSFAEFINERGQIAGLSYTDYAPNPGDGGQPALHPFFWENGKMTDVGTLGGAWGVPNGFNNRGQVVGESDLALDLTSHPFLWQAGRITDLGTLGGDYGAAYAINDSGEIVGEADLPGSQNHHGFIWRNGIMTDLGTLGSSSFNSFARYSNSKGQVVGKSAIDSTSFRHGTLWENGGPMIDLNALIPMGSDLTIEDTYFINESGEIVARGVFPNGDEHAVLLIPDGDCDDSEARIAALQNKLAPSRQASTTQHRYRIPGRVTEHLN
ncbi:MAG: hypothetical protein WBW33_09085 [Bryobacteraceae bacterium]